ncbi:nucleolar protein 7-like, partial [Neolamprologus brichardi]|uniref:nucleolar protein 7-like n=1 Tax=Neolamprologus brichardi TaxID=32507 RepID=UPI001643A2EC
SLKLILVYVRQSLFTKVKLIKRAFFFPFIVLVLFVSLKGKYTVTTVKERTLASFQQQVAEEFIQSRLYGPGTCRTTNNEMLSLQNKKGWNKSAAVQFVKKDWGTFRSLRLMT